MLVSSFNFLRSFNYTPYLFYKKRFKSEIISFCLWTPGDKLRVNSTTDRKLIFMWLFTCDNHAAFVKIFLKGPSLRYSAPGFFHISDLYGLVI